ncbi:MAG: hypothetical protein ACR2H5_02330 [Ktedonobacteraceae bacterium]
MLFLLLFTPKLLIFLPSSDLIRMGDHEGRPALVTSLMPRMKE